MFGNISISSMDEPRAKKLKLLGEKELLIGGSIDS